MKLDLMEYFFVDIDGTIIDYRPGAMASLLGGNFLFPIIRDMMVEHGWNYEEAGSAIVKEAENIVFWDYNDLIARFEIPEAEAFARMRQWHKDYLTSYGDMVETVKVLAERGKKLIIISNNPYWGCRFKLECAGLADHDGVHCFKHIFGTNIVSGCKSSVEVWKRALAQLQISPDQIATIGDNHTEDGVIPQSCGIGYSFILNRQGNTPLRQEDKFIFLNDARIILTGSI
jgi:FMN phosphatase YigB (HAD superfamily)